MRVSVIAEHLNADPTTIFPDGRFNHVQQVNDRLRFLRFLLKDGQLWLCKQQATEASDSFQSHCFDAAMFFSASWLLPDI